MISYTRGISIVTNLGLKTISSRIEQCFVKSCTASIQKYAFEVMIDLMDNEAL